MTPVLRHMEVPQSEQAAVTVMRGAVGAHVGVRYAADDDGARRHIHLAFHHQLTDEAVGPDGALWVVPTLRAEELSDVATSARLIAKRHATGRVPYAFDKGSAHFSPEGSLVLGESAGLTCATFVLVLFAHANVHLLDEGTWEVRGPARMAADLAAQQKLVGYLRTRDPKHATRVEQELGCTRFRGEEVAAASGIPGHPIPFSAAEAAGTSVLASLPAA